MNLLLLLAALLAHPMPKGMERARAAANKRVRAERQWQTVPRAPRAAVPVQVPLTGSYVDAAGRKITVSFMVTLLVEEPPTPVPTPTPIPTPTPTPTPTPAGITFAGVQDSFGAPVTASSAGRVLFLKGTGFPVSSPPGPTSSLRLALAGREVMVEAWTATSIQWHLDNSFTDPLLAPVTGPFEVWSQQNGLWKSLGRGGQFTVLPSPRVGSRRRR